MKLRPENLAKIPGAARCSISTPRFDRTLLPANIVHIGTRAFGSAFLGAAADAHNEAVFKSGKSGRGEYVGIVAASIKTPQVVNALAKQGGLYIHVQHTKGDSEAAVRGSIISAMFGPDDPERLVAAIAAPATEMVTLTISNKGYLAVDGELNLGNRDVQSDINTPGLDNPTPQTVYWYLAHALRRRQELAPDQPLVVLSLDNVQDNGPLVRRCLRTYLRQTDQADLIPYIEGMVDFPRTVVDRITPVTTREVFKDTTRRLGILSGVVVVSEDWFQFVVERGRFPLPLGEAAGVEFVQQIGATWARKGFALNGGHCLVGLLGQALGLATVAETTEHTQVRRLLRLYHQQISAFLGGPDRMVKYGGSIIDRFRNPFLGDLCYRVSEPSIRKVWQRLMDATLQVYRVTSQIPSVPVFGTAVALTNLFGTDVNDHVIEHDQDDSNRNRMEGVTQRIIGWATSHDGVPTNRAEVRSAELAAMLREVAEATGLNRFAEVSDIEPFVQELGYWLIHIANRGVQSAMTALLEAEAAVHA